MSIEMTRTKESIEGDKRQRIPYVVKVTCEKCGRVFTRDYSRDCYLSYPELPSIVRECFCCPECDSEETHEIGIDLVVTYGPTRIAQELRLP